MGIDSYGACDEYVKKFDAKKTNVEFKTLANKTYGLGS